MVYIEYNPRCYAITIKNSFDACVTNGYDSDIMGSSYFFIFFNGVLDPFFKKIYNHYMKTTFCNSVLNVSKVLTGFVPHLGLQLLTFS